VKGHLWFIAAIAASSVAFAGEWIDEAPFEDGTTKRYVALDDPALALKGTPISVQARFKMNGAGHILECGVQNRPAGVSQAGYALYSKDGRLRFGVNRGVGDTWDHSLWDDATTRARYDDGEWHHVTGVFHADGKTRVKIYIDGEETAIGTRRGQAQPALSAYTPVEPLMRIGSKTNVIVGGRGFWIGSLDEIRIWNVALSPDRIKANWSKPVDPATGGLVAYWKFDEERLAIGDTVHDATGVNHGVVAGFKYRASVTDPFFPVDLKAFPEDDFDYAKYPSAITGYTGQNRQRIAFLRYEKATRTRVGPRGNYKAGLARLADGKLVLAVCRNEPGEKDPTKRAFQIYVYESTDVGLSWREIAKPVIVGKEPALAALPDGAVLLTAQDADFTAGSKRSTYIARSEDGGRTWEIRRPDFDKYPRNILIEDDGSLLFMGSTGWPDWDLRVFRSTDGGRTWTESLGKVSWDAKDKDLFDEVSVVRLDNGALVASLRREIPGMRGEGFEDTVITRSADNGKTWSTPVRMTGTAEVHVYLTKLSDGRLLATHSNYHLPYGVKAIVSSDGGKTWDHDNPVQVSLSSDLWVGWPVTLELPNGDLITSYAATTYWKESLDKTTCEVVRWRLPK